MAGEGGPEQFKAMLGITVPLMVAVTAFGSALALGRAVSSAM